MNFNFSKPKPVKTKEKKVALFEKFWAGLNLISMFGDFMFPKNVKENVPLAWKNIIVLGFIIILAYLGVCGIMLNVTWIIEYTDTISFELGDTFYYYGFIAILFMGSTYFNLDTELIEYANKKKIVSQALKDLKNSSNGVIKGIENPFKKNKLVAIIYSLIHGLNTFWVIWGIIFYDRWWFVSIIVTSLVFNLAVMPFKNLKYVRAILIMEIIVTIILLISILLNHFYYV